MTAEREAMQADKINRASTDTAEAYIQRLLAETPPLSAEERRDLTRLLTAPDRGAAS